MKILICFFILLFSFIVRANSEEKIIDFYSVKDRYGEFSNFALFPIVIDEVTWPTSEHYYQAHKYTDPKLMESVRLAKTPMEAANIGRDPSIPKRADWDTYKDIAMEIAVRAKFKQTFKIYRECCYL